MDKKFYVPFETAQLLDKKGYPQGDCDMYYSPLGKMITKEELIADYKKDYTLIGDYNFAAPAYCEVLDWLVKKEIYIDVDKTSERVVKSPLWHCYIWDKYLLKGAIITGSYPTREEAINAAIVRALEELI